MKLFMILVLTCQFALAQDESTTTSTKVEGTESTANDKADQVITNRRFRASNGSLSKLSMNASISYSGGSLARPLAADRPNISNAGDTTSIAGIGGTINASYRMNKLNRFNLGTGLQMLAPFNDDIDTDDPRAQSEFDKNQGELDVANPYFSFTNLNRFVGVQTITSLGLTEYTAGNYRDYGYTRAANLSVNTMYDFDGSPFSVGALFLYTHNFFDDNSPSIRGGQNETVFGVLPQAEYVIDDTFNVRTIVRSHWYQNTTADKEDYRKRPVTQSVGLGISLSRNVFLYPNLQFVWEDARSENTNVGITANINMF